MRNKTVLMSLSVIVLLGMAMLLGMDAGVSAQIDPTSQQQTIDAAVAQRLNATATAQAAFASTATIQAAFEAAVTSTAQAQQAAAFEATRVEASIQTAVAESVRATEAAVTAQFLAPTQTAFAVFLAPTQTAFAVLMASTAVSNAEWTPIELNFDSVAMVLVPAGCFEMGSDAANDGKPVHSQCVETPFWLDKTEVTQAQFVAHGGVKANGNGFAGDNRPVEQITWFEAREYCEARGGRLPSEAEWEYAARGSDGLVYPWGAEFVGDNIVYDRNSNNQTAEVGSKPAGASWVGALDLSGNVWEWTSSLYQSYPYDAGDGREVFSITGFRVRRGGSWGSLDNNVRAADRDDNSPDDVNSFIGFRCALSPLMAIQTAVTKSVRATEMASTLAALGIDTRPVTANADWTPIELDFDSVAMVYVPAGCFEMGRELGRSDETPVAQVCFDAPFWLDKTEVAQAQFVAHGGVKANPNYFPGDNRPVEQITWFEARDYCEARGGRLPTEAEWEYAARGPDGLAYPWGDEFIGDNVVYGENSGSQTADVGSKPSGASWVGALDLSGNVWEWMSSLYKPYPYVATDGREADSDNGTDIRVWRGGSWNFIDYYLQAAFRSPNAPAYNDGYIGFRCALS